MALIALSIAKKEMTPHTNPIASISPSCTINPIAIKDIAKPGIKFPNGTGKDKTIARRIKTTPTRRSAISILIKNIRG